MKVVKHISLGMLMQALVMIMHLFIHSFQFTNSNYEEHVQVVSSFVAVILITYLIVLRFNLPIYAIISAQIITLLFIFLFENEGVYLLYYLHKGTSQWFNPNIYVDTLIIILEMLVIQLATVIFVKLTKWVYRKMHK